MSKKLIILFLLGIILTSNFNENRAYSQANNFNDIATIEKTLFNQSYDDLAIDKRLTKIEQIVYGQAFDNYSLNQRINKIKSILQAKNQNNFALLPEKPEDKAVNLNNIPGLMSEINSEAVKSALPPIQDTTFNEFKAVYEKNNKKNISNSSYPIINELENTFFGQVFAEENIYKRLDRLELKLYGQKSTSNLSDRVDNLSSNLNLSPTDSSYQPTINENNPPKRNFLANNNNNNSYDNYNYNLMDKRLENAEIMVFNKSFDGDICLDRIDRLEKKVFGKVKFGLIDERLDKIEARLQNRNTNTVSNSVNNGYEAYDNALNQGYQAQYENIPQNNIPDYQNQMANSNGLNQVLNNLENNYFGRSYNNLDPALRLNRLEKSVFGQVYAGNITSRLQRLTNNAMATATPGNAVNSMVNNPNSLSVQNIAKTAANTAMNKAIGNKGGILGNIGRAVGQSLMGGNQNYNQNYYGY